MWQTSLILHPRPNLRQHYCSFPSGSGTYNFDLFSQWFPHDRSSLCRPPQRSVSADIIRRMESLFWRRVPRATLWHVMTCNDDDITITTGTRLHASMQILSIQRTAMHTTLCTPQHNTGGGSRSTLVVSKGSRDPLSLSSDLQLISCKDCRVCMCWLLTRDLNEGSRR